MVAHREQEALNPTSRKGHANDSSIVGLLRDATGCKRREFILSGVPGAYEHLPLVLDLLARCS